MAKARTLVGLDVRAAKIVAAILDAETGELSFQRLLVAFAVGAVRSTEAEWRRPDIKGAAQFVDATTGAEDVVLDVVSPTINPTMPPALTFDVQLRDPHVMLEAAAIAGEAEAGLARAGQKLAIVGPPQLVDVVAQNLGLTETTGPGADLSRGPADDGADLRRQRPRGGRSSAAARRASQLIARFSFDE